MYTYNMHIWLIFDKYKPHNKYVASWLAGRNGSWNAFCADADPDAVLAAVATAIIIRQNMWKTFTHTQTPRNTQLSTSI